MLNAEHGGSMDPDFIKGLVAGLIIGSLIVLLIKTKRNAKRP